MSLFAQWSLASLVFRLNIYEGRSAFKGFLISEKLLPSGLLLFMVCEEVMDYTFRNVYIFETFFHTVNY